MLKNIKKIYISEAKKISYERPVNLSFQYKRLKKKNIFTSTEKEIVSEANYLYLGDLYHTELVKEEDKLIYSIYDKDNNLLSSSTNNGDLSKLRKIEVENAMNETFNDFASFYILNKENDIIDIDK